MSVDVKEAATRKLGPLPAWGWGVAIGGAFLVFRLIKPSSGGGGGGGGTVSGGGSIGSGPVIGTGGDATPTDVFSGANSLVEQLQDQVDELQTQVETQGSADAEQATRLEALQAQLTAAQALITGQGNTLAGLSGTITNLSDFQTLQTKLNTLLKNYSFVTTQREVNRRAMLDATTAADRKLYEDRYNARLKEEAALKSQIDAIIKQMNGSAT